MKSFREWTKAEREAGFEREQRLMRSIHDSPVKLTQPIQNEASLILACQVNALRKELEELIALSWVDVGSVFDDAKEVLEKCK